MKTPRIDAIAICFLTGAAMLCVWLVLGGKTPELSLKTLNQASGLASWAQAIVAGFAILAVYFAATIPVRAEAKAREEDRRRRARGIALLLLPDVIILQGEINQAVMKGSRMVPPEPPESIIGQLDHLYLLEDAGDRLLQAIGNIRGVGTQVRRYRESNSFWHQQPKDIHPEFWGEMQHMLALCGASLHAVEEALVELSS